MIVGKKSENNLEPGYVWAPYIPVQTQPVVVGYNSKNITRKRKINKILNLGLDISDDFLPKTISSRYSTQYVNSKFYQTIEIKNPLS